MRAGHKLGQAGADEHVSGMAHAAPQDASLLLCLLVDVQQGSVQRPAASKVMSLPVESRGLGRHYPEAIFTSRQRLRRSFKSTSLLHVGRRPLSQQPRAGWCELCEMRNEGDDAPTWWWWLFLPPGSDPNTRAALTHTTARVHADEAEAVIPRMKRAEPPEQVRTPARLRTWCSHRTSRCW